jgi:hypothetical protein
MSCFKNFFRRHSTRGDVEKPYTIGRENVIVLHFLMQYIYVRVSTVVGTEYCIVKKSVCFKNIIFVSILKYFSDVLQKR